MLFDGLTVLQHRGQDAAGMVTADRMRLHLRKDNGLVRDVFQQHHMMELRGNVGLGHVRYPTAGSSSCAEAQPLYTNYPHGICVAHNGNLTNTETLYQEMTAKQRHVNTDSDSELLLNSFAEFLTKHENDMKKESNSDNNIMVDAVFATCVDVMQQCKGGYATVYLINGVGLVGFRDPHGIRPLVFGCRSDDPADHGTTWTVEAMEHAGSKRLNYCMASESVALDALGFQLVR
jgi:amidophosphoribosyltransferase